MWYEYFYYGWLQATKVTSLNMEGDAQNPPSQATRRSLQHTTAAEGLSRWCPPCFFNNKVRFLLWVDCLGDIWEEPVFSNIEDLIHNFPCSWSKTKGVSVASWTSCWDRKLLVSQIQLESELISLHYSSPNAKFILSFMNKEPFLAILWLYNQLKKLLSLVEISLTTYNNVSLSLWFFVVSL